MERRADVLSCRPRGVFWSGGQTLGGAALDGHAAHSRTGGQAWPQADHAFYVDETSLTQAALKRGPGIGFLPCFLGDTDLDLVRFRAPEEQHELGLWLLYHRDLRNTKRVVLFREHMQREIKQVASVFDGTDPANAN